jgi:hypothetical protein
MEKYFYLLLSLTYSVIWALIFIRRSDLRSKLLFTGLLGGAAGLISEFWYVEDYWQPPTILGTAVSVEDFIFGFGAAGVGSVLYQVFTRSGNVPYQNRQMYVLPLISVGTIIAMLVFNSLLHVNSIMVSSGVFLAIFALVSARRRDLIKPSLLNGLLLTLVAMLIYTVLVPSVPEYAEKYWLLYGTDLGVMINGIPVTEILWFFTFGIAAGGFYEYLWGLKLKN